MKRSITLAFVLAVAAATTAQAQTPAPPALQVIDQQKTAIIHRLAAPSTVTTGKTEKQALIASVPFAYNKPISLAADYKAGPTGKVVPKGTRGFDAGLFTASFRASPVHVYCLFSEVNAFSGPGSYADAPLCFMPDLNTVFGKPVAGLLQVRSYIPTSSAGSPMVVRVPEISEDGTPIDHDFHIDISFKRWFKNYQGQLGIVVYYKCEGHIINEDFLAVDADNRLRLDLGDGILSLRIDPADADHIYAEFEKTAAQP